MNGLEETQDWLATTPLVGLFLTVAGYAIGRELHRRTGRHPVTQPVLIAMVVVAGLLRLGDIDLATYQRGADLIGFLLGPATVALAVPLHRQRHHVRALVLPLLVGISVGAVSHGIGTARVLADDETEGAFAGLAMGLTALATSVLLPVVLWIF